MILKSKYLFISIFLLLLIIKSSKSEQLEVQSPNAGNGGKPTSAGTNNPHKITPLVPDPQVQRPSYDPKSNPTN